MRLEPAALPDDLPPEACFVGVHAYDVMLLGENLARPDACGTLAAELFPGTEQLPWSPSKLENPDAVTECVLEQDSKRLALWRGDPDHEGPRFERAYDLVESACHRLRRQGWAPADLGPLG